MSNYGSKLYKPEDLSFYDQPVNYNYEEEKNHEEASLSPCQVAESQPM